MSVHPLREDEKRGKGRPKFEPTREQRKLVQVLVGMQVPIKTIAKNVAEGGIDEKTLRKAFGEELEMGRENLVASLKAQVVKAAQNGNIRACTWLLERLGGPEFASRQLLGAMPDAPPVIPPSLTVRFVDATGHVVNEEAE